MLYVKTLLIIPFLFENCNTKTEKGDQRLRKISTMVIEDFDSMLKKYIERNPGWKRICLLLDYDGTLAPCGPHPDLTILPDETKEVLIRLSKIPEVFLSIR